MLFVVAAALVCLAWAYDPDIVTNHWRHWFWPW